MALPLRLAQALADAGHDVAFSTTTRSPALVGRRAGLRAAQRADLPRARRPGGRSRPALRLQPGRSRGTAVGPRAGRRRPAGRHLAAAGRRPARRAATAAAAPADGGGHAVTRYPGAAARAGVRQLRPGRGRLAAHRPVRGGPGGPDRGARGGHPERRRALRRVAAAGVPARRGVPAAVPGGAGRLGDPAGPRRRRGHRAGAGRTRAGRGAGLAGPGRHPDRHPAAPLGGRPARARPAALRGLHRARPGHRPAGAALPGRAPRPGRGWCSSTAGPARARSPGSWPRRWPSTAAGSIPSWPCWPTPAGARRPSAPATTG